MNSKLPTTIILLAVIVSGYIVYSSKPFEPGQPQGQTQSGAVNEALAAQFDYLSRNGNSSCSDEFRQSVQDGSSGIERIQGSCCAPMDLHRYSEQIEGLKKYADIALIPPDPYDIDAALAETLMSYYDAQLAAEEGRAYDYAMANSMTKGPCCCMCWGWYVYGGLAKKLIQERGFTGEQIAELWDFSDMCGGPGDHINH